MNGIFQRAIATQIATLTRIADPATEPLGYGTDLDCAADCRDDFSEIDPQSPRAIVQALIRRWTTPRGALVDDPDYGFDIRAYYNRGVTLSELRALTMQMASEARKDDRVSDIRVSANASLQTSELYITARITPADPDTATFTLTFAVTSADVLIDTITIAAAA